MKAPRLQSRAALGAVLVAAAAPVYSVITKASALGDAVEIALAPEMPRDLIEATRVPRAGIVVEGERAQAINASLRLHPRRDRGGAAVQSRRRVDERAAARAPLPHPGRLLRSRLRTGRGSPGGRPGRPQPRPPPGLPQLGLRHVVYDGSARSAGCQFSFTCDGSLRRPPSAASMGRGRADRARPCRARWPRGSALRPIIMPITSRLGAAADQAASGRRAYLLSPARRLGPECRLQQPLCRRRGVYRRSPAAS